MNSNWFIAATCGSLFIGYCIYFDHKRRSHPDFKRNLRLKRRKQEQDRKAGVKFPNLDDTAAVKKFFMAQLTEGEEALSLGDENRGVDCFANALVVTSQPEQLLSVLSQTIPPMTFRKIIEQLPKTQMKLRDAQGSSAPFILRAAKPGMGMFLDEDVE